jgi:hypothetical protein
MNETLYAKLASQVARQTPELAALDADIATQQAVVDALQATVDAAQTEQEATAAQAALAGPLSALNTEKARAAAIRSAIAQCQKEMTDSGLTVDVAAVKLAQAKELMWERIKAERDRRKLEGGYTSGGKWFHSDTFSRTQQIGLVMLGSNIPANTPWKTMDGSFVTMTQTLANQVFGAAAAQDLATFAAAEGHKAAMQASADPMAYNFSDGWPAVFGG